MSAKWEARKPLNPFLDLMLDRLNVDMEHFFKIAYVSMFSDKRIPDSPVFRRDVLEYFTSGVPPPYVKAFLAHLKNVQELPPPGA